MIMKKHRISGIGYASVYLVDLSLVKLISLYNLQSFRRFKYSFHDPWDPGSKVVMLQ